MTMILDGTNGITYPVATATGSATQASAGRVLQVVSANYSTNITTTSTSIAATGLTASITPSSSSSKILVFCSMAGTGVTTVNNVAHFEIYRNGSSVSYFDDIFGYGTANINATTSICWQDSPASTSALTYAIYWKRLGGGAGTIYINNYITAANQTLSSLTLMEISA